VKKEPSHASSAPQKKLAVNRKAGFDVAVDRTFEAGIQLHGDEIKSIRAGRLQLAGGYVKLLNKGRSTLPKVVLVGLHLSLASEPERPRALLLHAKEVIEIQELLESKRWTAVPLDIHFKRGWAKVLIGLGQGRKQYDKRRLLRERDIDRESQAALKRA
jgi:SsrA-binding protein